MKRWLRYLAGVVAVVAVAGLVAACGSDDGDSGADASGSGGDSGSSEKFTIGVSNPIAANPAVNNWQKGVEVQAESLGMDVLAVDANLDPNKQLADVQSLLDRDVDAILISPLDPTGLAPVFEKAKSKGVPIIGWSAGEGPFYATDFETSDFAAGKEAAETIAEQVGEGAKVAAIQGVPQIPIAKFRGDGFKEGAKAAGLDIVAEQVNAKDSADGARPIADAWRTKYGSELKAIFSYNDPSALGAASVVQGDFKPILTGINASVEGIEGVRQGRIFATWDQRTVDLGNACAWAAHQILAEKKELPPMVTAIMPRYTKENVDEWKTPDELLSGPLKVTIVEKDGEWILETSQ